MLNSERWKPEVGRLASGRVGKSDRKASQNSRAEQGSALERAARAPALTCRWVPGLRRPGAAAMSLSGACACPATRPLNWSMCIANTSAAASQQHAVELAFAVTLYPPRAVAPARTAAAITCSASTMCSTRQQTTSEYSRPGTADQNGTAAQNQTEISLLPSSLARLCHWRFAPNGCCVLLGCLQRAGFSTPLQPVRHRAHAVAEAAPPALACILLVHAIAAGLAPHAPAPWAAAWKRPSLTGWWAAGPCCRSCRPQRPARAGRASSMHASAAMSSMHASAAMHWMLSSVTRL